MRNHIFQFLRLGIITLSITLVLTSCGGGGGGNPPSTPPTDLNSVLVSGISASVLEHDDRITVRWEKLEGADLYKIYQYKSKTGPAITTTEIGNSFDSIKLAPENRPQINTIYYYRITWMKNGIEYGEGVDFVKGLYSLQTDDFEPNDSFSQARLLTTNIPGQAMTFALKDEANEIVTDVDWYKYVNPSTEKSTLQVKVNINETSSFVGKLFFSCFNDQGLQISVQPLSQNDNLIVIGVQPNEVIYFEIKTDSVSGDEKIGSYSITLTD